MSAALETKLQLLCGQVPRLPSVRPLPEWNVPAAATQAVSNTLGGTDVPASNPALDVGGHTTQSETSTVAVGSVVCSAWNDAGENFGANGFSGFGFSTDGGLTFTDGGAFPNGPSDSNRGDPSLAFSTRDSTFYYAALSNIGLSLWKSTNNCQNFQYVGPIHAGGSDDKELMAVDNTATSPHFGRIYVGWTNFGAGSNLNMVSFSDNGGVSWSAPATLPGSGTNGQGMYPAVAPNGDVYFALLNRLGAVSGTQDQWIYKSVDGGATWVQKTNIGSGQLIPQNATATSSCGRSALNGNIRHLPSPQIVIFPDASASAGYVIHSVYAYDSDGTGPDQSNVFYRRSTDGATTWAAEVKLNDDATSTDQFVPAIGVGENGVMVVSWYDRRLDASNLAFDRYATISVDKGLTWTPNDRVSDVSSPVAQTNPNFDGLATCYHGDYDQVAVSTNVGHVVWSDDRRVTATGPNPDVYHDRIVIGNAVSVSPAAFEGGTTATGTVFLGAPAPAGGAVVTLASSNSARVTVPASVVVPAGSASTTFAVTSTSSSTQTAVTITATFPNATTATTNVTVLASPTVASLTLSPTSLTGGTPATATVTLSGPAPAGGSVIALSSSAPSAATVPATLTIAAGVSTGTFSVTTLSQISDTSADISASLNGITRTATLGVLTSAGNATFDATLKVPRCTAVSNVCDTGANLVKGRGTMSGGVESNQPNTINATCADGSSGTFHSDESLDRLRISTTDGSPLAAGKQVKIDAVVWVFNSSDFLDVYFAPDATAPVWSLVATVPTTGSQVLTVLSTPFTLPAATLPAIRANFRFGGSAGTCTTSGFDDRDDLVFVYQTGADTTPPTVVITAPANNAVVRGNINVDFTAVDNVGVSQVSLLVDGNELIFASPLPGGTPPKNAANAPFTLPLNTTALPDGPHQIAAVAVDAAGNEGESAPITVTVDNTAPTVAVTSPPAGATVNGNVTVTASATDTTSGVASVAFLVDGAVIATDTSAPYSVVWATAMVTPGTHMLSARATDVAGNQTVSAVVSVTVQQVNQAPVVNAGPDLTITLPANATLNGTVTDDGLPTPPNLTKQWTKVSGPGTVTFASPTAAVTTATFSLSGVYVVRLTGSDGTLSSSDTAQVTVNPAVMNTAPSVNAGPDQTITLPSAANLSGTVTDDGLPNPPATVTTTWSKVSGPGTVTFGNASARITTATFSVAGSYVLRLTASDSALSASDDVAITVNASGGNNPCANLCTNPTNFTINGSFQSGNLGTGAVCYQTTSVLHGGNCGNFVSPRTLKVNGTTEICNNQNWASVPAARNGGYCIQTTAGNQSFAFFTAF